MVPVILGLSAASAERASIGNQKIVGSEKVDMDLAAIAKISVRCSCVQSLGRTFLVVPFWIVRPRIAYKALFQAPAAWAPAPDHGLEGG
jgi:hypothetical protein